MTDIVTSLTVEITRRLQLTDVPVSGVGASGFGNDQSIGRLWMSVSFNLVSKFWESKFLKFIFEKRFPVGRKVC